MNGIWLTRHGQSTENTGQRGIGLGLAPLTAEGGRQARALADALPAAPDLVVASTFRRSRDTAAALLERFPGTPLETWPVQEFSYLDPACYDGNSLEERRPAMQDYWSRLDPEFRHGPGAETFLDLLGRARQTLERLRQARGFTVVVSHGQFLRAVLLGLGQGLDSPADVLMRRFQGLRQALVLPNCCVIRLRFEQGRPWLGPIEHEHTGSLPQEP